MGESAPQDQAQPIPMTGRFKRAGLALVAANTLAGYRGDDIIDDFLNPPSVSDQAEPIPMSGRFKRAGVAIVAANAFCHHRESVSVHLQRVKEAANRITSIVDQQIECVRSY